MLEDIILEQISDNNINDAYIMMYFFDKVIIGKYENKKLIIPDTYDETLIDEIHIFNPSLELRYNKEANKFIKITDTIDFFEEKMFLIGNQSELIEKDGNKFTRVKQYGREIILPFNIDIKDANHNLRLVVHNLFDDEQCYICGYRLVNIIGGSKNE